MQNKVGRPPKSTVDYFPHDANQRRTIFILKNKYGLAGYSLWFQLLEILAHTPGHSYDCNPPENQEYFTAYMLLDWEECKKILDTIANLGAIDKELWAKGILWSDNFVARLVEVYTKRKTLIPHKPTVSAISAENIIITGAENTQSKGKEVKKRKEKKVFLSDSIEIGLAEFFVKLLKDRGCEEKTPKNLQGWAKGFDEIIRIDKRSPERIKEVLIWVQSNSFWQGNILCPSKLREQWGKVTDKMKAELDASPRERQLSIAEKQWMR